MLLGIKQADRAQNSQEALLQQPLLATLPASSHHLRMPVLAAVLCFWTRDP